MGTTGAFWTGGKKTYGLWGQMWWGGRAGPAMGRALLSGHGPRCVMCGGPTSLTFLLLQGKKHITCVSCSGSVLVFAVAANTELPHVVGNNRKKIALLVLITCRGTFGHEWAVHSSWKLRKWQNRTTSLLALLLICMGAFINVDNCRKSEFIHSGSASGQV